jgi:hypothetical protein
VAHRRIVVHSFLGESWCLRGRSGHVHVVALIFLKVEVTLTVQKVLILLEVEVPLTVHGHVVAVVRLLLVLLLTLSRCLLLLTLSSCLLLTLSSCLLLTLSSCCWSCQRSEPRSARLARVLARARVREVRDCRSHSTRFWWQCARALRGRGRDGTRDGSCRGLDSSRGNCSIRDCSRLDLLTESCGGPLSRCRSDWSILDVYS